jgi:hypothetical protein
MGVYIDETGSDVQARRVDFGLSRNLRQVADCGDLISGDANVCITPRISGTIQLSGATDSHVILCLCRSQ